MRILVYGATQVGKDITRYFSQNHHDVILLDEEEKALEGLDAAQDIKTHVGNPCHPATLDALPFEDIDVFCAVSSHDEGNILSAQLIKHSCKSAYVLIYLRNPAYNTPKFQDMLNAVATKKIDAFISPESVIADFVVQQLAHPGVTRLYDLKGPGVWCWSMMMDKDHVHHHETYEQFLDDFLRKNESTENQVPVGAHSLKPFFVKREGSFLTDIREEAIRVGDEIFFVGGLPPQVPKRWVGALQEGHVQKTAILGGGKIGRRIAERLDRITPPPAAVIIEANETRADYLSHVLDDILIMHGSALDVGILKEAKIGKVDAIFAVMDDDENNIFASLLGKSLGAKHATALVGNPQYQKFVQNIEMDCLIDPHELTLTAILQALPTPHLETLTIFNTTPFLLCHGVIQENASLCHDEYKALLDLSHHAIVVRNGMPIDLDHNTLAAPGDHVIVLMHNAHQSDFEELF